MSEKWKVKGDGLITRADIPYLEGLRDCNVEGAVKLIEAIQKYEEVRIWLEY